MAEKLIFKPPASNEPGFLRRTQAALEFKEQLNKDATSESIIKLVEFLLPYVKEPVNRTEARELLYEASEDQFVQLIDVVTGNKASKENPTTAQTTKEQSNTGQTE